ncbi:hypothetical protein N803_14615 [Knoellia subterranea KCTC 19937]|uniref:Uncharacterized protein n=1 Tax=Knoellia subterranea KCTC 19937 TaxID=1385521 RepID=A0A0A0JMI7_9MICO|nr:hypothetical protein N803_14615 [Knoellia subterranea KCTC 19937]
MHLDATARVVHGLVTGDADLLLDGSELFAATPRRMAHGQAAELAAVALARDGRLERPRSPGRSPSTPIATSVRTMTWGGPALGSARWA